ncbi:MAG: hypothetical protein K2O56_11290, partial [Muribaculaceae bacterium]|nr:hypothetical protein [Muribaculaceae bacterium]
YEKSNALASNPSYIVVDYALEGGITGKVTVPFTNTDESGNETPVNIVRNNLYRVVLGDGDPIRPGADVEVKIIDEPWEVIDLPVVVGKPEPGETLSEQAIANAALNVNRFARTPVGKSPEYGNLKNAVENNLLVFADDNLEPYEAVTGDADLTWCMDTSWATSINGELYRMPTPSELADLIPEQEFNISNTVSGGYSCGLYRKENADIYSIFINSVYSSSSSSAMYIFTGLTINPEDSEYRWDYSDEQAKIHKLTYDSDNKVIQMHVMALRTIDMSQLIGFNGSNATSLNIDEMDRLFETEDKLTFKFKELEEYQNDNTSYRVRTLSKTVLDVCRTATISVGGNNGTIPIPKHFSATGPYFNTTYCIMLIKFE